jgi:hypothetical protein
VPLLFALVLFWFAGRNEVGPPPAPEDYSIASEWQRIDGVAGLVLQVGSAALVASVTFAAQTHEHDAQVVLGIAAVCSFIAVMYAVLALGENPPTAPGTLLSGPPAHLAKKSRRQRRALVWLLLAVELGTLLTAAALAFD